MTVTGGRPYVPQAEPEGEIEAQLSGAAVASTSVEDFLAAIEDVLVFEQQADRFELIGGKGRGERWAGEVELLEEDTALVGRAWRAGQTVRATGSVARQIAGPYHAHHAAAVPVGQRHVVVFGSGEPINLLDSDLLRAAAGAVNTTGGVPSDKLLADELEVVAAVRALMAYKPTSVRETARHIAAVAARSLSCDVAAIRIEREPESVLEGVCFGVNCPVPGPGAEPILARVARGDEPTVEQVALQGFDLFGIDVASQMLLPLPGAVGGALAIGHAMQRPRGFTSLCQRIARAVSESAETLLAQAAAREALDAQVDLLEKISGTDALTGLANRRAWEQAVASLNRASASAAEAPAAVVVTCDVDDLKDINDGHGHRAGDAVLVAAANLLSSCIRQGDLVARIGGDEFALLLRNADLAVAARIVRRIRRAEKRWRVPGHAMSVPLSIGVAGVTDGDVEGARYLADERMYANKRRRTARRRSSERPVPERRQAPERRGPESGIGL